MTMPPAPNKPHPDPRPEDADGLEAQRLALSALMDGDASALTGALGAWRREPQARADWHAYHLVGDVLRSEDLAQGASHDQAFLARLKARLDDEPVRIAPAAKASDDLPSKRSHRRPAWFSGMAVAASVAALASVLWLGGSAAPGGAEPAGVLASADGMSDPAAGVGDVAHASAGAVLRDPRLDEFLRLHQMARGGMPVALPGSSLRQADYRVQGPARQ